ncbi:MAG TPA: carbohydrate ABC transporter permease [Chloroflexota bacterium]|nr:carbohydrate ABC transporter permease [Chloroflexota bacterium]
MTRPDLRAAVTVPRPRGPRAQNLAGHGLLVLGAVASLLPIYWMFITSLKPANDIFSDLLLPRDLTLDNYRSHLGWLNSLPGLIVPQITAAFAVVLLRLQMKSIPKDLSEAAWMDGASNWTILWLIYVPNIRSGMATLAILLFISTWNEYFWPLIATSQMSQTVIQVGLQMFMGEQGNLWGPLMAAASLASLPVLLIYLVLRRQVMDAFVRSGLR